MLHDDVSTPFTHFPTTLHSLSHACSFHDFQVYVPKMSAEHALHLDVPKSLPIKKKMFVGYGEDHKAPFASYLNVNTPYN